MSKKKLKYFQFQGFTFSVKTEKQKYFSEIEKYFSPKNKFDEVFQFEIKSSDKIPNFTSSRVHSTPNLDYFKTSNSFVIVFKRDKSFCEIRDKKCDFYLSEFMQKNTEVFFDWLFEIALVEVLRKNGFYFLHAGCVAKNEFCFVIPGASGNGKSTLSFLLSQNGFKLVSDDRIFFEEKSDYCFSFPTPVKITKESQKLLNLDLNEKISYQGKTLVPKDSFQTIEKAIPKVFLFPKISEGKSSLVKLEKSQAFSRLLPLSLTLSDSQAVKFQLGKMRSILENCDCFEFNFGQDFDAIPKLIGELL